MVVVFGAAGLTGLVSGLFSTGFSASLFTGGSTGRTLGEHAPTTSAVNKNINHLFPFDGGRRFGTDIIYNPVNSFYIINDLVRDFGQQVVRQVAPVGSHAVQRFNGTQADHVFVSPLITHHTYRLYRQKDGAGLPNFIINTGRPQIVDINRISFLQYR